MMIQVVKDLMRIQLVGELLMAVDRSKGLLYRQSYIQDSYHEIFLTSIAICSCGQLLFITETT